jgi:transcriptional regulator with XRE-family HTH domain
MAGKKPASKKPSRFEHQTVHLDGNRYVILRESVFQQLCRHAGVQTPKPPPSGESRAQDIETDRMSLAEKLTERRRATGMSQATLARRAGIRPETLNRIERGKTTPDFTTVRKLVGAMNATDRLIQRWHATGLSQAEVARRAGLKPEHLKQIARGRDTPDFTTLRKLVVALNAVEQE